MRNPDHWEVVKTKQIADCRVFSVREDISVNSSTSVRASFFRTENPEWINIIPLCDSGEVLLIEQFRHGIQETTLEIPGGMVDAGESPLVAAKRELTEETGYTSSGIIGIGKSRPNPAIQDNWIYHFLATDCKLTAATAFDEHENIITRRVSLETIPGLIETNKITHSLVIAAFYFFGEYRAQGSYYEN